MKGQLTKAANWNIAIVVVIISDAATGAGSEADVAVLGNDAQEDSELCS